MLLLLDNVLVAQLLSAEQQAIIGPDADLAVVVTTRLGPFDFPQTGRGCPMWWSASSPTKTLFG